MKRVTFNELYEEMMSGLEEKTGIRRELFGMLPKFEFNTPALHKRLFDMTTIQERFHMTEQDVLAVTAMERVLHNLGFDLVGDENMKETAERFVKYLNEFNVDRQRNFKDLRSYATILKTGFDKPKKMDEMVVQTGIPFKAMCAHHLLPMFGHASIGYIPTKRVVGLSKLARLVDAISHRRPSLQEHITNEVAEIIQIGLKPLGTMVVLSAEHMCMACRGVNASDVITTTSAIRGRFTKDAVRAEFFGLCKHR